MELEMRVLFQQTIILCALALFSASALADEPSVAVDDDGTVKVSMLISASEVNIREVLQDIEGELADLSPDVLSVEIVKDGRCQEIARSTRGLFRPFRFRSLRCPTAHGWHESLIESGDFSAYFTDWSVIETDAGTEVVYTVHTELYIFPKPIVTRTVVQSAKQQLIKLARKVARK